MSRNTPSIRPVFKPWILALAAAGIGWLAAAFWIAPYLIREAYYGRAHPFINGLIVGQGAHPVEFYLGIWRGIAFRASIALVALVAILGVALAQRSRISEVLRASRHAIPSVSNRHMLVLALLLGLVSGEAEAMRSMIGYWVFHRAAGEFVARELFWMGPLAACLACSTIAMSCILLRRLTGAGERLNGLLLFALSWLCVYAFGRSLYVGLHPLALTLFSAGIGAQVTRAVGRSRTGFHRRARHALLAGVGGLALWALWQPQRTERFARSNTTLDAPRAAAGLPNVLLLVWDTVRARSLSLYGYSRETTPNLDSLARQGVAFDAAVTTASWTLPAHASLFTGRYHHEHSADRDSPLDGTFLTLAEALGSRGYRTAGFVANTYWVGRGFGLDRGFQRYEDHPRITVEAIMTSWYVSRGVWNRLQDLMGTWQAPNRISAEDLNRSMLKWVDQGSDRPFFAFLNLFDAHEPYRPPGGFGFRFSSGTPRYTWDYTRPIPISEAELQELRDAYDSCIHYLDYQLGQLLKELDQRGLLDNTLVILTADHGETIGEHQVDLLGHENNIFYDVLNVPLVLFFPRRLPGGVRSHAPASLADVPATILDLVDTAGNENPFPGRSLVSGLLSGDMSGDQDIRPLLSQANPAAWHKADFNWPISKGPLHSLVVGNEHYIVDAQGNESLFDLASDPWERNDLSLSEEGARALPRYREELNRRLRVAP